MNVLSIDELTAKGYVIVHKKQLLDMLIEVNLKTQVDKRVKWIDRKTAIAKYNVTRYWLQVAEQDCNSVLKVNVGSSKTATKKYNEQSIINELERQAAFNA